MFTYIKKFLIIVLFLFLSQVAVSASSLGIDKESVDSVKIYTLYSYPGYIRGAVPLNLTLNTREAINEIVDMLNTMGLSKPPQNGDGGTGTSFFIEIKYNNGNVEKYTQYAYDFYMGDLKEDVSVDSYYITNNPFMEFYESTLYKANTIPSDGVANDILNAAELQVIPQMIRNNYKQYITREQFCDLVLNVLNTSKKIKDVIAQNNAFPVFKDTICASANILYNDGIVTGKATGEFCPDDCISLEEAITIMGRIAKKYNISGSAAEVSVEYIETASPWAREHISQTLLLCENFLGTTAPNYKDFVIVENAISMVMQLLYNI